MQITGISFGSCRWAKHAINQGLQAIGLANDDRGVFVQGLIGQLSFKQLSCAT